MFESPNHIPGWRWIDSNAVIALLIFLVSAALYAPTARYDFVQYDDPTYVFDNPQVQAGLTREGVLWAFRATGGGSWHPITWLSFMGVCHFFGANAGPQHVTNFLLHGANALLLFLLLAGITGARWRSALVAALFAWHPLHVESVAWIAERKDVLSTTFFLLSLFAYSRYVTCQTAGLRFRRAWYLLLLAAFLLGLMSKPMLVSLPFVCLLLDFWPLSRVPSAPQPFRLAPYAQLIREKIPLFAASAVFSVLTIWAQSREGMVVSLAGVSLPDRLSNAAVSYWRYMGKALWPEPLAFFYPHPSGGWGFLVTATAFVGLGLITALAFGSHRRFPFFLTGWLWFVAMLVPVIGLVQVGTQAMADRYTYLPLIGIYIVGSWALALLAATGRVAKAATIGCSLLVCGACILKSRAQMSLWRDSETLFTHADAVIPNNRMARLQLAIFNTNLGLSLAKQGRTAEALARYQRALQANPRFASAHNNLGLLHLSAGRLAEAAFHFTAAIGINPDQAEPRNNLGTVLVRQGRAQEATAAFREAVRCNPASAEFNFNLGLNLSSCGRPAEAAPYLLAAVRLRPDYGKAHYELGILLATLNQPADARAHLRRAVDLGFQASDARLRLADLALRSGDSNEALRLYRKVLEEEPDSASALNDLAWLLATCPDARWRNGAEALALARRAVALWQEPPAYALDTLAAALAETGDFDRAAATARQALAALSPTNHAGAASIENRLRLYETHRAYSE